MSRRIQAVIKVKGGHTKIGIEGQKTVPMTEYFVYFITLPFLIGIT
jgi:hypothetical protein